LRLKTTQTARDIAAWYEAHVSEDIRNRIAAQLKQQQANQSIPERIATWAANLASQVGPISHYVVEIVLFPVLAFYFALDSRKIKHEFVGVLPRNRRRAVMRVINDFNGIMYSFVVGQAILCAIAGVVVGTGLAALHVKYPLTLGLLAGITRAIPIIGPIVGGIPIIGLVLATKGIGVALMVLGFFTCLHFAESKFLMPYLIGDRMNLHPVVIIIVLLIGEEFGGLLGMFFAAPVAALIRVLVRRYWLRSPLEFPRSRREH
jgi:predicted PurR-regulated permease PerM